MISINKPCHENWNDMTSTQQGAFCGKCQIDVIDFSKMDASEIKQTLMTNKGKHLCGRFEKKQLIDLNESFENWENQSYTIFQSKFLLACLIVFGISLFSCENEQELPTLNKIELNSQNQNKPDILLTEIIDSVIEETNNIKSVESVETIKMGKVAYEEINTQCNTQETVLGGIGIDERYFEQELYIKGDISYEEHHTINEITTNVQPFNQTSNNLNIEAKIFPNPAQYNTTLQVNSLIEQPVRIHLIDSKGTIIKEIYGGNITIGSNQFEIGLDHQTPGNYFIIITGDELRESIPLIIL